MPRRPMDFYETSKEAVDALVEHYITGDGKTDSVTCAWMIWDKHFPDRDGVIIVPKRERQ